MPEAARQAGSRRSIAENGRTSNHGRNGKEGLLRDSWREEDRLGGRCAQGLSQTGAQVSSRRESRATRRPRRSSRDLSEANEVLSDPKKRKIYDQLGFYSDNIDPNGRGLCPRRRRRDSAPADLAAIRAAVPSAAIASGGQREDFDFRDFDFGGARGRAARGGSFPRHLLRHLRRGGAAQEPADDGRHRR